MSGSITLVGRASGLDTAQLKRLRLALLALEEYPPDDLPAATWQIIVWDPDTAADCTVNLRAGDAAVLKQLCRVCDGHQIRVIAEPPGPSFLPASCTKISGCTTEGGTMATYTWRLDSPDVQLTVTRLELLSNAREVAA